MEHFYKRCVSKCYPKCTRNIFRDYEYTSLSTSRLPFCSSTAYIISELWRIVDNIARPHFFSLDDSVARRLLPKLSEPLDDRATPHSRSTTCPDKVFQGKWELPPINVFSDLCRIAWVTISKTLTSFT